MSVVRLTIAGSEFEAEIICGLLRTNGIAAETRRTDVSAGMFDGSLGAGGPTEIVVDEQDLDDARAVLAARGG
jgi:putative signal transducing protein